MEKQKLIEKLETIKQSYKAAYDAKKEVDNFVPEDNYERKIVVPEFPGKDNSIKEKLDNHYTHIRNNAVEEIAKEYDKYFRPKKPKKPNDDFDPPEKMPIKMAGFGCVFDFVSALALIVCLAAILLGEKGIGYSIGIGISAAYIVFRYVIRFAFHGIRYGISCAKEKKKFNEKLKQKTQKYDDALKVYNNKIASFPSDRKKFLEEYSVWHETYLEHYNEELKIRDKLKKDQKDGQNALYENKYLPLMRKAEQTNDIVPEKYLDEYLSDLSYIIRDLKENNAYTLEEAFSLRDEAQRERIAYQKNLAKKFEEDAKERERQQALKATKRCHLCRYMGKCRLANEEGAYNCTGFVPNVY